MHGPGFRAESRNVLRLSPKIRSIMERVLLCTSCLYRVFALLKVPRQCVRGGGTPPGPDWTVGLSITCRG